MTMTYVSTWKIYLHSCILFRVILSKIDNDILLFPDFLTNSEGTYLQERFLSSVDALYCMIKSALTYGHILLQCSINKHTYHADQHQHQTQV